jgi:ferritin-like metal-binding protein YciE
MAMKFQTLEDLLIQELKDLYDAEQQLVEALPKMMQAAENPELQEAFRTHLQETEQQVTRLEQVFEELGVEPEAHTCKGMKGLISEGQQMLKAKGDAEVRDAGLIGQAQRVEHYEIAAYGTARTLAQRLGRSRAAELLQTTLDEEGEADKKLTAIAQSSVNPQAAQHSASTSTWQG